MVQQPQTNFYESLDMQTLLRGTVLAGPAVGALVSAVVASTKGVASVRQVTLTIDGRDVALTTLSDEEVNELLPELIA